MVNLPATEPKHLNYVTKGVIECYNMCSAAEITKISLWIETVMIWWLRFFVQLAVLTSHLDTWRKCLKHQ